MPTPVAWSPAFGFNFRLADAQTQVRFVQLRDGSFWVVWTDNKDTGVGNLQGTDLVGQRYDAFGVAIGGEVRLNNNFFVDNERNSDLAADIGSNEFFIAFEDLNADGSTDIILERKNGDGSAIDFAIIALDPDDSGTGLGFRNPKVAVASATSGLVVVERTDSAGFDAIVGQRFDPSTGDVAPGGTFLIGSSAVFDLGDPQITVTSDGRYAVVWTAGGNIFGNFVTQAGSLAGQFTISSSALIESAPSVAALASGNIVVTWTQNGNVVGSVLGSGGAVVVPTFVIANTGNVEDNSRVVATGGASFVVAWENPSIDDILIAAYDVGAGSVTQSGTTTLAANVESISDLALIALGDGRVLLGYDSPLGTAQIFDPRGTANVNGVYAPSDLQIGTPGNDVFTAATNANIVDGWDGNDIITDGAGTEVLIRGGIGNDTIRYTFVDAGETADGGPGTDTLVYLSLAGATTVNLALGTATTGGVTQSVLNFENFFTDQAQDVTVTGAATFSNLATGSGNDTLDLGVGGGLMLGGTGNDTYFVNSVLDNISELIGQGNDTVNSNLSTYQLPNNVENLNYTGLVGGDLRGNGGHNVITGSALSDLFRMQDGGNDTVNGGDGNDGFYFGNFLNSLDFVDGGAGTDDQVALQGSQSLTMSGSMLTGVETIALLSGSVTAFGDPGTNLYSYSLAATDSLLTGTQRLTINANALLAGENLGFNGSAETSGTFRVFAGLGTDFLVGGGGNDGFFFGEGRFNPAADQVNGGSGLDDQLALRGDYNFTFAANAMQAIDTLVLISARHQQFGVPNESFSYNLTTHDNNLASGARMTVTGQGLRSDEIMTFNGSFETNGSFRIIGGEGDDVLIGGSGADDIFGGLGADGMIGNANNDIFIYTAVSESTIVSRDTIFGFGNGNDKIDLSAIDAILGNGFANDAFTFIGSGAFTAAGQVRVVNTLGGIELQANIDGDLGVDFVIGFNSGLSPAEADIIL